MFRLNIQKESHADNQSAETVDEKRGTLRRSILIAATLSTTLLLSHTPLAAKQVQLNPVGSPTRTVADPIPSVTISATPSASAPGTATISGTVFYNDRRKHGLFESRRNPDGAPGERCDPNGVRDDGRVCSVNWLGAQYMVVDVIEIDKGYFAPTAWNCKKEKVIASVAVNNAGKFSVTIPTTDDCKSDSLKKATIKLSVRMRFCGDWCFSMRDAKGNVYSLYHPGASEKNRLKVNSGDVVDVGRMNFNPAGQNSANATDLTIAANYYAAVVDSVLTLHRDNEIPFYKDEFGEVEFTYPSTKSGTATARAPDEVAISTFESREVQNVGGINIQVPKWVSGLTATHEYGHILMQRAWDGGYGYKGVGISGGDSGPANEPARQIAFKEAWAAFIEHAVYPETFGCGLSRYDDNSRTPASGPLGEGATWRLNVWKALCDWYDDRDDDDTTLSGSGDDFAASTLYSMWYNMRRMYVDADKYGGQFKSPGLWFCDWVDYYLAVRKSVAAVGATSHNNYEAKIQNLIYNNNIGCFMPRPS